MRSRLLFVGLCLFAAMATLFPSSVSAATDTRVYELRTYTTLPGRQEALLARFRDHTTSLFAKHGMTNVGYWQPVDAANGAGSTLTYLLAYPSREAAKASWKAFGGDPEWQKAKAASETDGKIVAKVESLFLAPTDFSPSIESAAASKARIFELRTYTTEEGRLDALDARFRDHTRGFFKQYGMTNVAYFHPLDADKGAGRTLVYLLAHKDREAATASWTAFRADPKWTAAKVASEKAAGGSLTIAGPAGIKSVFLAPTDFSKMK